MKLEHGALGILGWHNANVDFMPSTKVEREDEVLFCVTIVSYIVDVGILFFSSGAAEGKCAVTAKNSIGIGGRGGCYAGGDEPSLG